MKLRYILVFLILFIPLLSAKSQQIKKFSEDPTTFFGELTKFFQDIDNPDDKKIAKEFIEKFTIEWNAGKFTDEQKKEYDSYLQPDAEKENETHSAFQKLSFNHYQL